MTHHVRLYHRTVHGQVKQLAEFVGQRLRNGIHPDLLKRMRRDQDRASRTQQSAQRFHRRKCKRVLHQLQSRT